MAERLDGGSHRPPTPGASWGRASPPPIRWPLVAPTREASSLPLGLDASGHGRDASRRAGLVVETPTRALTGLAMSPWLLGAAYAALYVAWPANLALVAVGLTVAGGIAWHRGVSAASAPRWRWLGQDRDGQFWLSTAAEPTVATRVRVQVDPATRDGRRGLWLVLRPQPERGAARQALPAIPPLWCPVPVASCPRSPSGAALCEPPEMTALRELRVRLRWALPNAEASSDAAAPLRTLKRLIREAVFARAKALATLRRMSHAKTPSSTPAAAVDAPPPHGEATPADVAQTAPASVIEWRDARTPLATPADDPRALSRELAALLSDDPDHVYSDDELDAIEALDAELALRIDRAQTFARREAFDQPADGPIDEADVRAAIDDARRILAQDGGDIEFVRLDGRTAVVRLKGACVGCPRSTLDLKNVVERLVRARAPGVERVANTF